MQATPTNFPKKNSNETTVAFSQRLQRAREAHQRIVDSCFSLPMDSAFWADKENWAADSNAFVDEPSQPDTFVTTPAPQPVTMREIMDDYASRFELPPPPHPTTFPEIVSACATGTYVSVLKTPAPSPQQSVGAPTEESSILRCDETLPIRFGDEPLQQLLVSFIKTEPEEDVEVINLVEDSDSGSDTETDDEFAIPRPKRLCVETTPQPSSNEELTDLDSQPFQLSDVPINPDSTNLCHSPVRGKQPRGKTFTGKQPPPPQPDAFADIETGGDILVKGFKRLFSSVVAFENLEDEVIGLKFSLNFKLVYNGGEAICDAETLDHCDKMIFKTEDELKQERKKLSEMTHMEEFFIPINPRDPKYRENDKNEALIVDENSSIFNVLEAFKLSTNRKSILRDSKGRRYQLLTLEQGGFLHTYQRFVVDHKYRVYRLGTRECNYRLPSPKARSQMYLAYPIAQLVAMTAITRYNKF